MTKADLHAIKQLIDSSIDERIPRIIDRRVQPMLDKLEDKTFKRMDNLEAKLTKRIDNLDDTLSLQMENGLQEVRVQIVGVQETVARIEQVQQAEIERADRQETTIKKLRQKLRTA